MAVFLVFPKGKEKALTLSYDDGVDTDERMIELMEKYGVKCTFNINAGAFGREDAVRKEGQVHFRLSKRKAKELYNHPLCEVATHSYTHPRWNKLPTSVIMGEILDDRRGLEQLFGGIIRGHAYPYGSFTDEIVDILGKAGIAYARTTKTHHSFQLPNDWLRLGATCHHVDPVLGGLTERFVNGSVGEQEDGWLFYLWGHTYEFRRDDNWNVIENFFEKVSNNDNIWYATNIEVYEYITAWRSLVYSADGGSVYNPTATDVWVKVRRTLSSGSNIVAVPAGATVELMEK